MNIFYLFFVILSCLSSYACEDKQLSDQCSTLEDSYLLPSRKSCRETIRILSLEGGGMRAVTELEILRHIEREAGKPICQLFDIIGGTSAGAILAALLTVPDNPSLPYEEWMPRYSADQISDNLLADRFNIFKKTYSCKGLLGALYSNSSLKEVGERFFGTTTFDQSIIPTLVTTFDMDTQEIKIIKSWSKKKIFSTADAVFSSAAGPVYFPPYLAGSSGPDGFKENLLIDGGIYAMDPTLFLRDCARNKKLFPNAKNFEIVALGSGKCKLPFDRIRHISHGVMGWGPILPDLFLTAGSCASEYLMRKESQQLGIETLRYSKWSPTLSYSMFGIDNTSDNAVQFYREATEKLLIERQDEFKDMVRRLKEEAA